MRRAVFAWMLILATVCRKVCIHETCQRARRPKLRMALTWGSNTQCWQPPRRAGIARAFAAGTHKHTICVCIYAYICTNMYIHNKRICSIIYTWCLRVVPKKKKTKQTQCADAIMMRTCAVNHSRCYGCRFWIPMMLLMLLGALDSYCCAPKN